MKFIADVMVGKLARRLRTLGYDVVYSNRYRDDDIVRIACAEDRIILTRDTHLGDVPCAVEIQRRLGSRLRDHR